MAFTATTSGSTAFRLDITQAILQAFAINGYSTETPEATDMALAMNAIDLVFSDWTSRGNTLFTVTQATIPLAVGQVQVTLPQGTVDVYDVSLRSSIGGTQIDAPLLTRINRDAYAAIPNKLEHGTPTMFWLDRQYTPVMSIYQPSNLASYQLVYFAVMQIQDSGSPNQVPAIPYRWQMALVRGLAVEVALFKKNYEGLMLLKGLYEEAYAAAAAGDRDKSNMKIEFDLSSYSRRNR